MASFEFFFGLFGLISSDSKSLHRSRLDNDWRLLNPLGASLFGEPDAAKPAPKAAGGERAPIFSASGTLAAAATGAPAGELGGPVFSSASSSSVASVASSTGSGSTVGSGASLIRSQGAAGLSLTGKKYEFGPFGLAPDDEPGLSSSSGADELQLGAAGEPQPGDEAAAKQSQGSLAGAEGRAWGSKRAGGARALYCRCVCLFLWLYVLRLLLGLVVERSALTLDFYHLGAFRIHFLIPALCVAIQVAAVSLIFIRNNDETNWLVPFYSSKDYLIRSRSNFRPRVDEYTRRVNVSIGLALALATASSLSLSAYLVHCAFESAAMRAWLAGEPDPPEVGAGGEPAAMSPPLERLCLAGLLVVDILWALYSTYICFLVSFYFNLICSIMKSRFHSISKIIEDLAESNTSKTTNQARKITTLYLEHNEACELLDESNDFWQYLIFFTYFTYIPAYCYCLYNLFFVDFEAWPAFVTWVIHTHTGFIILLISFSAAGVSTEAHAPYTSLHTLSLIQLPLDVEVNIATFLHRVRGLTIGYSCYDLFAITNASMSNTAAACASYFLIVADFSRSSVFNSAQMNSSAAAAAASGAAGGGVGAALANASGSS